VCIVVHSLEDLKETISSGAKLGLPVSREAILPQMKPYPIPFIEDNFFPSPISLSSIPFRVLFNVGFDLLM
ncbi:hypothetical protein ACRB7L_00340, partial [Staphylococcus aureus]|uniref:hypothetical protein n=1 Tax=Staphylococcus aureus TaxID=1280 RepID=UPI003D6A994D